MVSDKQTPALRYPTANPAFVVGIQCWIADEPVLQGLTPDVRAGTGGGEYSMYTADRRGLLRIRVIGVRSHSLVVRSSRNVSSEGIATLCHKAVHSMLQGIGACLVSSDM